MPRPEAEHLHEPAGALEARTVEVAEQFLGSVPEHQPSHHHTQDQYRQIPHAVLRFLLPRSQSITARKTTYYPPVQDLTITVRFRLTVSALIDVRSPRGAPPRTAAARASRRGGRRLRRWRSRVRQWRSRRAPPLAPGSRWIGSSTCLSAA